eukprot:c19393_g2_i1 orf=2-205(-)
MGFIDLTLSEYHPWFWEGLLCNLEIDVPETDLLFLVLLWNMFILYNLCEISQWGGFAPGIFQLEPMS